MWAEENFLMDEIAKYNIGRWAALANANAVFARPRAALVEFLDGLPAK
jgi:hypothetical protein